MTIRRPLIGLNMDDFTSGGAVTGIRPKYWNAVLAAGGVPVCIPHLEDPAVIASALSALHGFILTGGDDIPGERYGAATGPTCVTLAPERERGDFALISALSESPRPVLAICLGFQELNVARGGTMIQDLIHEVPGSGIAHYTKSGGEMPDHDVEIAPDSRLAAALGAHGRITVNSSHHQAVKTLGKGLEVAATAPDGIVEGVVVSDHPWFLGVQWHPEGIAHRTEQAALFKSLVNQARKFL